MTAVRSLAVGELDRDPSPSPRGRVTSGPLPATSAVVASRGVWPDDQCRSLPAPALVTVRTDDLEPGDRVAVGDRVLTVDVVLDRRSIDGLLRVVLGDGSRHTCAPSEMWEVARG